LIKYDIIRYEGVQTKRYRAIKLGTQLASNIDVALNLARGRFGHNVSVRGVNPKSIINIDHSRPWPLPEVEYGIVEYPKELIDKWSQEHSDKH
jgi:hypothetical protein